VALIFGFVAVGVADERALPVMVGEGIGHSYIVGGMGHIEMTAVVVPVMVTVGREVDMVESDILRPLNGNASPPTTFAIANSRRTTRSVSSGRRLQRSLRPFLPKYHRPCRITGNDDVFQRNSTLSENSTLRSDHGGHGCCQSRDRNGAERHDRKLSSSSWR
jgi:hypothetical protein